MERSYHGFSYKDIAEPLGIKNAAVHYHFPSKEDLGVALIDDYRDQLRRRTADFMARGGNPANQLEGYVQYTRDALRSQRLCPMGVLAIDFAGLPPRMRRQLQLLIEEILAWLTHVLDLGRREGVFDFSGPPEAKAIVIKASLQGAAQLARAGGEEILDQAAEQIRRDLRGI